MTRPRHARALVATTTLVLAAIAGGAAQQEEPSSRGSIKATIPPAVVTAGEKIANDPQVLGLIKEQSTDAAAKARWNQFLELVRIPSPPRQEHLKAAEIHRRLVGEWGFSPDEVMTRDDGVIPTSDTNIVDGLPVYNACVLIKGSYASRPDAQNYKGQFPKVLVEGHIDVVNPEDISKSDPNNHLKLQPYAQPVVATPEELAAIPDELSFDARGRVVENDKYVTASRIFANAKEAQAGGGVRIYVPGYGDMMPSTSNAFVLAAAMKKHKIRPVYDIWICGTAGEEGKGNLAGMKQLYGFDQKAGNGSNPLNIVANFGLEGGGIVNFVGSYRFEMKFKAPFARPNGPSAAAAMAASIAKIAEVKTPTDLSGPSAPKTTYTVGRASCEPPARPGMGVPSCSLEVDMRSTRKETLEDIRKAIEPTFQAGVSAENARFGRKDGSSEAISLELVWFGLRPAYVAESVDNIAVHAGLQSGIQLGVLNAPTVSDGSGSLNDNVPAHTGVPTYQFSLASSAAGAGGHAFWEWGTRGTPANEVARMHRVLTAALIASGFHAADGTIVPPGVGPIGARTRDVVR